MSERPTGRPRTIDPEAVSLVALRLFDDRGYESVSMDDIADAAGVSRRSLFRLFPTKASLVWGGIDEFSGRFAAALDARPADESTVTALRAAYRAAATFPDGAVEVTRHRLRVIHDSPTLEHEGALGVGRLEARLVEFVADRDGTDPRGLTAAVRAAAFAAAASSALTWWALHGEGRPEDVVDRALAELAL